MITSSIFGWLKGHDVPRCYLSIGLSIGGSHHSLLTQLFQLIFLLIPVQSLILVDLDKSTTVLYTVLSIGEKQTFL